MPKTVLSDWLTAILAAVFLVERKGIERRWDGRRKEDGWKKQLQIRRGNDG
jgi:hypothetical protein